jgi:ribosome-associated protein
MPLKGRDLADRIAELILDKKGQNIAILDLQGLTSAADFFVIASAEVDVQIKAIIDHLSESLLEEKVKPWHVERTHAMNWVLLDFVDVVVHLFLPERRDYYGLERLWADAKTTHVKE